MVMRDRSVVRIHARGARSAVLLGLGPAGAESASRVRHARAAVLGAASRLRGAGGLDARVCGAVAPALRPWALEAPL